MQRPSAADPCCERWLVIWLGLASLARGNYDTRRGARLGLAVRFDPLHAASSKRCSVRSFPLYVAFFTLRVICLIRLPNGMRRALPLTVTFPPACSHSSLRPGDRDNRHHDHEVEDRGIDPKRSSM